MVAAAARLMDWIRLWYHWHVELRKRDHRIRLDDYEIGLVVSALNARLAGVGYARRRDMRRLSERLSEGQRGNPWFLFGWSDEPLAELAAREAERHEAS